MILLIYIYYLKNFLSIADIKNILEPLTEHFYEDTKDNSFYNIYREIFEMEHTHNDSIKKSILETFEKAQNTFRNLPNGQNKEMLQQFSFIALLGYDIYLRKQVIEKMIDQLYQTDEPDKKQKKKK